MEIVKEPDKILHTKVRALRINPKIKGLIKDMKKLMIESHGIGLAANQVGLEEAIFIIDEGLAQQFNAPNVYINPVVEPYSKNSEELEEGCLSIPGIWLKIKRVKKVKIRALNENGQKIKFIAKGMLARVLQHEHDHLQGVLITDHKL